MNIKKEKAGVFAKLIGVCVAFVLTILMVAAFAGTNEAYALSGDEEVNANSAAAITTEVVREFAVADDAITNDPEGEFSVTVLPPCPGTFVYLRAVGTKTYPTRGFDKEILSRDGSAVTFTGLKANCPYKLYGLTPAEGDSEEEYGSYIDPYDGADYICVDDNGVARWCDDCSSSKDFDPNNVSNYPVLPNPIVLTMEENEYEGSDVEYGFYPDSSFNPTETPAVADEDNEGFDDEGEDLEEVAAPSQQITDTPTGSTAPYSKTGDHNVLFGSVAFLAVAAFIALRFTRRARD